MAIAVFSMSILAAAYSVSVAWTSHVLSQLMVQRYIAAQARVEQRGEHGGPKGEEPTRFGE